MNAPSALFIASGVVALAGAAGAVGFRNIFHNILGFSVAMLGVGGVFLSLGADFLAAVFVLVYVGAVAIAMVYAVMLSHPLDEAPRPRSAKKIAGAAFMAVLVAGALWLVIREAHWAPQSGSGAATAAQIGSRFLGDYVLAFELVSVLLLVAMMGAVMVARRTGEGRGTW